MVEQAVLFPPASEALVGVLTTGDSNDDGNRPAAIFLNAGMLHRVGPNRLYVRLARQMARRGFSSLRFDLSGIGDSRVRTDGLPLRTAAINDVRDALDFLSTTQGTSSFILIGLCSGADLAFRVALADKRVVGAVLIDGLPYRTARSFIYDQLSRIVRLTVRGGWRKLLGSDSSLPHKLSLLFKKRIGTSASTADRDIPPRNEADMALRQLAKRGARTLVVYTEGRGYNYARQFVDLFPSLSPAAVQVEYLKGAEHTFDLLANQDRLVQTIESWITKQDGS